MPGRRSPFRRNRSRGGAAVELLLSVPFLFIFSIATFDFVRGTRTVACGHRAARQIAWCASRHAEDSAYPDVPANTVVAYHYYDTGAEPTSSVTTEDVTNTVSDLLEPITDILSAIGDLFGMGDDGLGRGVVSFASGKVTLDVGTATKQATGLRIFSATVTATHKVALRSHPEEKPDDPIGWFDPIQQIMDEIKDLFS
jgi:hypothetical protein